MSNICVFLFVFCLSFCYWVLCFLVYVTLYTLSSGDYKHVRGYHFGFIF